jgi:NAD(P)-dependent dehydrogenase (short-subunit alcohol dehydrogenase family)
VAAVFITGSSTGLGLMVAQRLLKEGHKVTLHARNARRADEIQVILPGAETVLVGDLSSIEQTRNLAEQANKLGHFTAIIHNAGVGFGEAHTVTEDGLAHTFAINVLAPYLITACVTPPDRLIFTSAAGHFGGHPDLSDLGWNRRPWDGPQAYFDSKLLDVTLAFAVARLWPGVLSNAMTPGWVPTRLGGPGSPDNIHLAPITQTWLAVSDDPAAKVTGRYFYHQQEEEAHPAASSHHIQAGLLERCAEFTGVPFPTGSS